MIYLTTFKLSEKKLRNPNIYPYNILRGKESECFLFDNITVFYGNNGSGKSTLLNIIAKKLDLLGGEEVDNPYFYDYVDECTYGLGETEYGVSYSKKPKNSKYVKSEDILYEIKKIQQASVLEESILHEQKLNGLTKKERVAFAESYFFTKLVKDAIFGQEKYSNGETSLKCFDDILENNALYLLDEPEISLTPQKQVELAEKLNTHARLLGCQFIVATHSPFMLGTLNAKIYNLDSSECEVTNWKELENVKFFYEFFKKNYNK